MAYGSPHTETIPTVGVTLGPAYATAVNAVLTEMRTTLNAKVTPSGIDMNADLTMLSGGTRYGFTNVNRVSLYQQPSLLSAATYPAALYANSAGELYFNDGASNQVKITSGGGLNGTPGSITGAGYGSAGVEVNWDSGAGDYHMYSGSGTYADVNARAFQISDASSNLLRLTVGSMSANYTLTLPAAVPGANTLMTMDASGNVTNTGTPTTTSMTTTGTMAAGTSLTVGTTLNVTGAVTVGSITGGSTSVGDLDVFSLNVGTDGIACSGDIQAGTNRFIQVQGTGTYRHGEFVRTIPASAGEGTASGTLSIGSVGVWTAGGGAEEVFLPIQMKVGERIVGFTAYVYDAGAGFIRCELFRLDLTTGTSTQIGADADSSGSGVDTTCTISGLTETVTATRAYYIKWTSGTSGDRLYGASVTYDHP